MTTLVYANAASPEALQVTVNSGESGVDMTTATAASMLVQMPDGEVVTWTASIGGNGAPAATASALVAVHVFSASDVVMTGRYVVVVNVTFPMGVVRAAPQAFTVVPRFAVTGVGSC